MKMKDIDKKFTEVVSEYIGKGYSFNSSTMSGHQGEICKVDLVNDEDHFIRVWMESSEDYKESLRMVKICVGEINEVSKKYEYTIWYRDLTEVDTMIYYRVGDDWYIESRAQALDIMETHYCRLRNPSRVVWHWDEKKDITSPKTVEVAVKYLKRVAKYQRVSRDEITIKHYFDKDGESRYYIMYKGQTYRLK